MKLVLGQALTGQTQRTAHSRIGNAHLTYRGLIRQIRRVSRVSMPSISVAGENRSAVLFPNRYRYSAVPLRQNPSATTAKMGANA